jgi:hypothetical protein
VVVVVGGTVLVEVVISVVVVVGSRVVDVVVDVVDVVVDVVVGGRVDGGSGELEVVVGWVVGVAADEEVVVGAVVVGADVVVVGLGRPGRAIPVAGVVVANGPPNVVVVDVAPDAPGSVVGNRPGNAEPPPPSPSPRAASCTAAGVRPVSQLTPANITTTRAPAVARTITPEMRRPTRTLLRSEMRFERGAESARRCAICFARSSGLSFPGSFGWGNEWSFHLQPPRRTEKL